MDFLGFCFELSAGAWPIAMCGELAGDQCHDNLAVYWNDIDLGARLALCEKLEQRRELKDISAYQMFLQDVADVVGKDRLKQAKVIKNTKPKKQQTLRLIVPYPRDMTRCSPFFPVPYVRSKDQAKVLPYLNDWPLASNAWGTLTYKGPTLTTAHEDIMVALLSLIQDPAKRAEVVEGGSEAYAYRGSLRELLVATGCKQPNGQEYEDAFDQLADLCGAVVSVLNTKGRRTAFSSLISGGRRDDERFGVTINPQFLRAYREGDISYQSLQLRSCIRSLVGRALYRFVAGQSEVWKGSIQKLSGALNVQLDKGARRKIRGAITELIELRVLGKGSGVTGDTVVLVQGKALR